MCTGVALGVMDLPDDVIERHGLQSRIAGRAEGAARELRFLYRDPQPVLPVWQGTRLTITEWGCRDKASRIPATGWCRQENLEAGKWAWMEPEPVDVPACFLLEKGVWYQVRQGVRALLVRDERENPHVYLLTQPASHYYAVMTRNDRMPVLIEETI